MILAVFAVPTVALMVYPLWRICERLGRPGYLSLLTLVPFGFIVLLWVLALSDPPTGRSVV
jgi:hypothetical protein